MDGFKDVYYPYDSAIDFFGGGYAFNLSGLHLTLAYILIFLGFIRCVQYNNGNVARTLSILYFSLQPYNNAAFTLAGVSIADACGMIVGTICITRFIIRDLRVNSILIFLLAFCGLSLAHGLLVWGLNPEFGNDASLIARITIIAKVLVMVLVFCWIYNTQDPYKYIITLSRSVALFSVVCCIVYVIQLIVFLSGTVPYGSFAGAGYSMTISFGGVSIERGHLSKFMASIFVPIIIDAIIRHRRWVLILYLTVMLLNFSASGLSFLIFQMIIAAVLFWDKVKKIIFRPIGVLFQVAMTSLILLFSTAYGSIIAKVYRLVFLGDESDQGGRSFGLLLRYIQDYPFGIGYSGSTYRTAPGLPEINMGIYAFISQMSIMAIYYIICLIAALSFIFFRVHKDNKLGRLLLVSALTTPLVFFADTLWFSPPWWIGLFWLLSYRGLPEGGGLLWSERGFSRRTSPEAHS